MKLSKDFGIRALFGTIAGLGFYGMLLLVFWKIALDLPTTIALVGLASAPWTMAVGFYFGMRIGQK
ncbi:MAG: hypothetical protein COW51_00065 [Candidatus Moranbacteria bacterium CG17_big_fil_post_rev_8_21_14_2_50_44_12]|nr:MAG: hypothetical protein COW51_00065 [Candidatus Moranbacteria bacterium CG17_big_fil_post_rev_8_21_14_2_50_44_12]